MSLAEVRDYEQPSPRPDRTPPQDVVAEQCVLGSMLMSKDAIADVVEVIRGTDFYRPAHELVYDAVLDLYGRGEPADAITVADELTKRGEITRVGGHPYLHDLLASVPVAANAGYYAEIVREKAILRRLVDASVKIAQLGYGAQGDVDEIVDAAQAEVYSVTDRRASEDYQPLSALMESTLDEIEAIEGNGGVMAGVPTGFAELDELTNGLHSGQMIIVAARPAMGKALALDTPLPTPRGWTTMGLVDEGDQLLDGHGLPTTVVAATEVMTDRPCFEVTFSDGTTVVADAEHQWQVVDRAMDTGSPSRDELDRLLALTVAAQSEPDRTIDRDGVGAELGDAFVPMLPAIEKVLTGVAAGRSFGSDRVVSDPDRITWSRQATLVAATLVANRPRGRAGIRTTVTTTDMAAALRRDDGGSRWAVPLCDPIAGGGPDGADLELPIPPYAFGAWLGADGRLDGWFSPADDEVAALVVADGVAVTPDDGGFVMAEVTDGLQLFGVGRHHRRLPTHYLRASMRQRRSVLAGIVDTAGEVLGSGEIRIAVAEHAFARHVHELVTGLGYRADLVEFADDDWWVCFAAADDVFRAAAGKARHQEFRPAAEAILPWRTVTSIEPVPSVPVRCVEVDNPDRVYLASRAMVPTHNSTLGLDLARACSIKHGLCSAIFSLEMSQTEITMRLLSAEADIPLNHIRKGQMTEEDWTRLSRKMGEVSEAPLFIDDSPNLTMMEIRAKARRLKQRHDLRLVVIDYMQLMTSGKKVESRQLEVSEFSRQIKLLAKELGIPVVAISQLNRGPEQRTDKRPMVADLRESGCLTAETRVARADTGTEVTLGELLDSDERMVPVWSTDADGRVVARPMTHAFPSGRRETFAMTLASGRVINATANHPFRTLDGWTALGDLAPGSRIAIPRALPDPIQPVAWDPDELLLLAHMIGDGSCLPRQPLRYASVDEANLEAVAGAAARRFGITAKRDEYAAARVTTLRLPSPYPCTHGRRNPMNAWLDEHGLFGCRSHEKSVPDRVFSGRREDVAYFLRHLWATDGSIRWDPKVGQGRIYYATTSRRLADDVARLLLRFGIVARIETTRKAGYRDGYHVVINGATDQLQFCTEIGCHGERGRRVEHLIQYLKAIRANTNVDTIPREVWERVRTRLADRGITHREFADAMQSQFGGSTLWKHAPSRARLGRAAQVLADTELETLASTDLYWDSVTSIESIGIRDVYDATVLDTHNFIADGVVVHNSLEQDADMIILLHRDDYYDRESARLGEADFIVAKHRNGPTRDIPVVFQGHYSRFRDMQN